MWRDLLIVLAGAVTGAAIGSLVTVLAIELKHDCMPHDPHRCKGVGGG